MENADEGADGGAELGGVSRFWKGSESRLGGAGGELGRERERGDGGGESEDVEAESAFAIDERAEKDARRANTRSGEAARGVVEKEVRVAGADAGVEGGDEDDDDEEEVLGDENELKKG